MSRYNNIIIINLRWHDLLFSHWQQVLLGSCYFIVKENIDVWNKYTFTNSVSFSRRVLFSWNKKEKKRKH